MSADEFAELRASIRDRGLIEPIELYEGQVLDGRHRLQACIDEHCEPRFVEFSGGDPWLRVWDRNGARREWSGGAGQKYAVWRSLKAGSDEWAARQKSIQDAANAARSEKAKARPRNDDGTLTSAPTLSGRTGTRGSSNKGSKSKAAAAGVDRGTVEKFERVANVAPDLAEKIQTGETTLTKAEREVKERAREAKREQNRAAIVAASKTEQALGVYSSIVIDPPWDWGDEGDQDQLGRSRPTYGTMSIDALLDLPVGQYAAQDAHLYLWITNRSLPKGFALLERWSFRYVMWFWKDTGRWCLIPFAMLCGVFQSMWQAWRKEFRTAVQATEDLQGGRGWHSECVFVPRREVWAEIYKRYGGSVLHRD